MSKFKIELGVTVKDVVTEFTGIITWRVEYLSGCPQYGVQPPMDKNGVVPDAKQFDENRLKVTDSKPIKMVDADTPKPVKGGVQPFVGKQRNKITPNNCA